MLKLELQLKVAQTQASAELHFCVDKNADIDCCYWGHLYLDAQGLTTIPQEVPIGKEGTKLSYKRLKFLTDAPKKWYSGQTYWPVLGVVNEEFPASNGKRSWHTM